MSRNKSLAFKLIIFFWASSLLIFSFLLAYNYRNSREIIRKDKEQDAQTVALLNAARTYRNGT